MMQRICVASLFVSIIYAARESAAKLSRTPPLNDFGTSSDEKWSVSHVAAMLTTVYTLNVRVGSELLGSLGAVQWVLLQGKTLT